MRCWVNKFKLKVEKLKNSWRNWCLLASEHDSRNIGMGMMDSCYSGIQVSFSGQILLNLRVIWKQHDNDEICIGKHRLGHISCLVRSPRMMVGNVRAKKPPPTSFMTSLIVIGFISMTMISGFCCFLSPKLWFPLSMQVTSLKTGYPKSAFSLWQIAAWLWKWDDFFPF